jgi:ABC-type nitrate/sulfonate/bicarbonate transport system substrate-binding protein
MNIKMNKKLIILILLVTIICVVLVLNWQRTQVTIPPETFKEKEYKVTYAIPTTIAAIPSYVAADQGFWKDHGLDVQLKFFNSGREALDALLANQAEVMSVSETPPMHAVLQGHDIYWVSTVTQHQEAKLTYNGDVITDAIDIVGKNVATQPGTNSDYYMYLWLENYDIKPEQINIVSMKPPTMVQGLLQGDIDAFFAWEPHNYKAYSQDPERLKNWETNLYSGRHSIIMNQAYVKANPEVVEKLILGFIDAENYIKDNPESAKEIVAKTANMDMDTLDSLWDEYKVSVELDDNILPILNKEAAWASALQRSNQVIPNFRTYIYTDALNKLWPDRVGNTLK